MVTVLTKYIAGFPISCGCGVFIRNQCISPTAQPFSAAKYENSSFNFFNLTPYAPWPTDVSIKAGTLRFHLELICSSVEGVNSSSLGTNCYPFLLHSLGLLWDELMALVYSLTVRNKMLAASSRSPKLYKLKSSISVFQRQPLRMNTAAHFCNRIWRWTC